MRNVLRFPVSREFKKIIEDDHEWQVITDANLRPLVAKRSPSKVKIPAETYKAAYLELYNKIPHDRKTNVYDLHTHPVSGFGSPSYSDLKAFVDSKLYHNFQEKGINIIGSGVITADGITIIKINLPDIREDTGYGDYLKNRYRRTTHEYLKNELGQSTWKDAKAVSKTMDEDQVAKISKRALTRTFSRLVNEEPNISVRTIRRHMRRRMRR